MARIKWVEDDQATGETQAVYDHWRKANPGRETLPEILKCFSSNPTFLAQVMEMSYGLHFQDGQLPYRTKEMLATYVSALNQCRY